MKTITSKTNNQIAILTQYHFSMFPLQLLSQLWHKYDWFPSVHFSWAKERQDTHETQTSLDLEYVHYYVFSSIMLVSKVNFICFLFALGGDWTPAPRVKGKSLFHWAKPQKDYQMWIHYYIKCTHTFLHHIISYKSRILMYLTNRTTLI